MVKVSHRLTHRCCAPSLPHRLDEAFGCRFSVAGRIGFGLILAYSPSHAYETGGMRRTHLRGQDTIYKRLCIHGGAFNLGLVMRKITGMGTPRGL